ncbi:hypothetical protein ACIQZO_33080 [Streptomyces sp. NPDC097617]
MVFLLEILDADAHRAVLERAARELRDWLVPHAGSTAVHFLGGENTEVKL